MKHISCGNSTFKPLDIPVAKYEIVVDRAQRANIAAVK